jgi:protocatechuate 3,4-dioxygenase beta subunit
MEDSFLTPRDFASHPGYVYPSYGSSVKRGPTRALIPLKERLRDQRVPVYGTDDLGALDHDLTRNAVRNGEPLGERIIVTGRVLDENARPVRNTLVEIWQANAAGRYVHKADQHDAPLDPNFLGAGRCVTDNEGRYRFLTIKPGAYPWRNHYNAWRPAHLHFSLFGLGLVQRLVTQMYFPGDPLLAYDPMYNSVPDELARRRLIADFDWERTIPDIALAYRFDIVLRGRDETPMATKRS